MGLHGRNLHRSLLLLSILTICISVTCSSSTRERRRSTISDESSHETHTGNEKLLNAERNELSGDARKKVSQRMVGGYLQARPLEKSKRGMLTSSSGGGRERKASRGNDDDDEKKTLSQQVKEGKYGLIQDEIYSTTPKRPGIVSYLDNPEVPKDTIDNLGGLREDEIWLAENHVLVLRGGKFLERETASNYNAEQDWKPIDDYQAPRRQIKIPSRPKVPPPFPIQLKEGGPIQIIGANGTINVTDQINDYENDSIYKTTGEGQLFVTMANGTLAKPEFKINVTADNDETVIEGRQKSGKGSNSKILKVLNNPESIYHALPPGAVFLPPPVNLSDYDDEDQSIYYPPPYSFHYHQDNTTVIPPGPLVPGIILPPPPDFFASLDEPRTTKKYPKRPGVTPTTKSHSSYLPSRKTTVKNEKNIIVAKPLPKSTSASPINKIVKNITTLTPLKRYTTIKPFISVTTPVPKSTTLEDTEIVTITPILKNQVYGTNTEKKNKYSNLVSSKSISLVPYYPTTTRSTLERPIEVTSISPIENILTTISPGKSTHQASYYFYEEPSEKSSDRSTNPPDIYYGTTTEPSYYKVNSPLHREGRKNRYNVKNIRLPTTEKINSVKSIHVLERDAPMFDYNSPETVSTSAKYNTNYETSSISNQPFLPLKNYYTTKKENYYENSDRNEKYVIEEKKPKPIYQYSFEIADYSRQSNNQQNTLHNKQPTVEELIVDDENRVKQISGRHYQYENPVPQPEIRLQPKNLYYTKQRPIDIQQPVAYVTSTEQPLIDATPSPDHAYFTKQEERLLDDVTKEYFTIFGQKLRNLPSTTPLYGKSSVTERPDFRENLYTPNNYNSGYANLHKTPKVRVYYGDQSKRPYVSLKDDISVDYKDPLPPVNQDSEYIAVPSPKLQRQQFYGLEKFRPIQISKPKIQPNKHDVRSNNGNNRYVALHSYIEQPVKPVIKDTNGFVPINIREDSEIYPQRPISLADDTLVNYRDPRPKLNPDAEFITPVQKQNEDPNKSNAYFAYRLPGDGGHFYFLTPQAVLKRQDQHESYLYPKLRSPIYLRQRQVSK